MLQFFKRIIYFAYLLLMRWSKRKHQLEQLLPKHKKRELDIAELPSELDGLKQLPNDFNAETSLSGFNSHGLCINVKSRKTSEGLKLIQLDLDIPGYGYFHHKELVPDVCGIEHFGRTRLKCLDPMRRWQVQFHGLLQNMNAGGKKLNASIFLYWQCLFDPYDFLLSPSCWSLAGTLSHLSMRTIITTPIFDNGIFYNQWGELRGRVCIEGHDELNVKLKSVREMEIKYKNSILLKDVIQQHFVLHQSGLSFSQQGVKVASESVYFGRVTFPIADSTPSTLNQSSVLKGNDTSELLMFPQQIKISSNSFGVHEEMARPSFGDQMTGFVFKRLSINSQTGYGIEINKTKQAIVDDGNWSLPTPSLFKIGTKNNHSAGHIVSLDKPFCISRSLVGGKAYHLALVNSLGNFNVPKGLVITTEAFEEYLMKTSCGKEASKRIKSCLRDDKLHMLKQHCEQAVHAAKETAISETLGSELERELAKVFREDWYKKYYAVRSSGVGEDSVQTSAAGQLKTFLGIQGLDNILAAVRDCWASSFAYHVVEYRQQNGQELLDNMGVIIQEMVNSDVSGVVFTMDPVLNDASKLIITANYGLGESVVSGDVDADTIVVDRHDENNLVINKRHKGKKETKSIEYGGEVKTVETSETQRNAICVKDEQIMLLTKQVLDLENAFGAYLDIEWTIQEERLYILQVRPITSLDLATDDDLIHEFDSPLTSDNVFISTCNIQEMMPGAVPTLSYDLFIRGIDIACNYANCSRIGLSHPVHAIGSVPFYCGFGFINMTHFDTRPTTCFGDGAKTDFEVSIIGQEVKDHTLQTVKDFIGRKITLRQRLMSIIRLFVTLKRRDSLLFDQLKKKVETLEVGKGVNDSHSLYRCIDDSLIFYFDMCLAYIFKATESVVPAGVAIMFLKKGATNIGSEAMADMALILANCGEVESAEVPFAIHDIAECIARSNIKDQFLATPIEDCDVLLRNATNTDVQATYIRFMEKHGHRGIREADLMEKSWSQDPRILIQSVKQLVIKGCLKKKEKAVRTPKDIVNSLHVHLNLLQRLILKWSLVKSAKDGVAARELGKSVLVKTTYIFKSAYWRLAELMVCENRLPEQELLFFLTHREIGELIESRSACEEKKTDIPKQKEILVSKGQLWVSRTASNGGKSIGLSTFFHTVRYARLSRKSRRPGLCYQDIGRCQQNTGRGCNDLQIH